MLNVWNKKIKAIIEKIKEVLFLNVRNKRWIIVSCIVLILGAFGYGYFSTVSNLKSGISNPKPGTRLENMDNSTLGNQDGEANKPSEEDRVAPSAVLVKKVRSINSGKEKVEEEGPVPKELVNLTRGEVERMYNDYDTSVEFSRDIITVTRELPYLPKCLVVKLEYQYIKVFQTDEEGNTTPYDFEPVEYKNTDEELEKGIEVETEEEIYNIIQDYE
jgi:hypothetical protein